MKDIKLYIFDLNATLTNTPFIDKAPLAVLPGRKEKLAELKAEGAKLAVASNQGGVAFGYTTEYDACNEIEGITEPLGIDFYRVAFGHPTPKRGYEKYGSEEYLRLRKPAPGMLMELIDQADVHPQEALMVGDLDEDRDAADAAGCKFIWAKDFFGSYESLLYGVYNQFRSVADLLDDHSIQLQLKTDGSGEIGWIGCAAWAEWESLEVAVQIIDVTIKEHKERKEKRKSIAATGDDFDPFLDSDDLP